MRGGEVRGSDEGRLVSPPPLPTSLSTQKYKKIKERIIISQQGSASVLPFYDNDLSAALSDLFPDIGIDKEKFRENKISQKLQNRRKSFEDFAIHHNFDPKNPWNWYNQPRHKITAWFVATKVLSSLSLLSFFPLSPLPLPPPSSPSLSHYPLLSSNFHSRGSLYCNTTTSTSLTLSWTSSPPLAWTRPNYSRHSDVYSFVVWFYYFL